MRRATDERVREAIDSVLGEQRIVETQARLHALVLARLRHDDAERSVTARRVRRVAARADSVRLDVRSREGPADKVVSVCPVCGGALRRVKNQTLFGGEVTLVLRCVQCLYWTSKRKRVPTKYTFRAR